MTHSRITAALRRMAGASESLRKAVGLVPGLDPISQYLRGGRLPWSPGYSKFKNQLIREIFANPELMERFRQDLALPEGFGPRLDERVVECPWTVAHIRPGKGRILDAGSVFNTPLILELPEVNDRTLFIYSRELDSIHLNPRVSYIHGDFREPVLRDELFETVVCISTLEHVGMWPTPKPPYEESLAKPQPPKDHFAYRVALSEFRRMLIKSGQFLLTVPFGRYEDHDWQQQFDAKGIQDIIAAFGGECRTETYYRYCPEGWQKATRDECAECSYFNIVRTPQFNPDYAAAARAVACLELIRTS